MRGPLKLIIKASDYLDRLSDSITNFRALIYTLGSYVAVATLLSVFNKIPFSPADIVLSSLLLVAVCKLSNLIFSKLLKVPVNHESDIITGLILALILSPANDLSGYLILGAAGVTAMLSKFLLTYNAKHLFNPAALGALVSAIIFNNYASWWVGSSYMTVLLLVGGFMMVRKMRRFIMVSLFILFYFVYQFVLDPILFGGLATINLNDVYIYLSATPIIFFATIMLTEPLTSPAKSRNIIAYSLIVAICYSVSQLRLSPEQALLIGNLSAFVLEPNRGLMLKFIRSRSEAAGITSYFFSSKDRLSFQAGQYLEWTLPGVGVDARGNRRYLTIASSPTEKELMVSVKLPQKPSKFKSRLSSLKLGQQIVATRLAGEFILPKSSDKKLVFIAGGIGITPFRSIIKSLVDLGQKRDISLFYFVNQSSEIAFKELLDQAINNSVKTTYVETGAKNPKSPSKRFNTEFVGRHIPDYKNRDFYISGPQGFVAGTRQTLLAVGVSPKNIKTDFFPGYN
jgi:glycine betaine catabolism B